MKHPLLTLCVAALLIGPAAAAAQTPVWRCGAEGRSYADSPCPGGRAIQADDARSADQRAEAREAVVRDKAIARQLIQERREREAEWRARGPGLIAIKPLDKPEPLKARAKKRQPSPFEARGTSTSTARASRPRTG